MSQSDKLANQLINITKQIGARFTLKGSPISYEDMYSSTGVLPAITKRADQLASLCLGYGLGASYDDEEAEDEDEKKTLMGATVTFDEYTPDVLRLFFITDVLLELVKSSSDEHLVSLDELLYD